MKFYTSVITHNNDLYVSYIEDGVHRKEKVDYKPYMFLSTNESSEYKTINGKSVEKIYFNNLEEARKFIYTNEKKTFSNGPILYGMKNFEYLYIYDNFPVGFDYDFNQLNVVNLDIENDSSGGFANIDEADKEINAITMSKKGKTITFGFFPYSKTDENTVYIQCNDEKELLKQFIKTWRSPEWLPDIITGWNCEFFDIPYIINRIKRVFRKKEYENYLSPFGIITEYEIQRNNGKTFKSYRIGGVAIIDYYAVYKKNFPGERESYTLNYIAEYELDEKKIDYSQYGSLDGLYKQNPELYYTYNIKDSTLIEKLEDKLHLIEQVVTIAYIERVNFENTLTTTRPWDVIIHNYLMDQKIVVPQYEANEEVTYRIPGGFVKEPVPGLYKWVISLDFTSLYPSLAIQYNISPDTIIGQNINHKIELEDILGDMEKYTSHLKKKDCAMTFNNCFFKRDKRGFFPSLMKFFFDERKKTRVLEAEAEKKYEENRDDIAARNIYLKYKNLQTAYKLINNSGYGAAANPYFRWFDNRLAEAITSTGQTTLKYVIHKINIFLNKEFCTEDIDYVIYADTDSCFVILDSLIERSGLTEKNEIVDKILDYIKESLLPYVDASCKEIADKLNAYEFRTFMKHEKICDYVFFTKKKRYAANVIYNEGILYSKPKIKVTGLETVRASVPKITREAMKKCFELIFSLDKDGFIDYCSKFKKEFFKLGVETISTPTSVRGLIKYFDAERGYIKGTPMHVRGSLIFNQFIKDNNLENKYELITDSDKVKCIYLNPENPTKENVFAFKGDNIPVELEIEKYIDYVSQYNKTFYQPMLTVCDAIGWDLEKVDSLDSLFE